MKIVTSLAQLHKAEAPYVVALGTFDGLHCGHVDVIKAAKEDAERTGAQLAVFTFSNHPYACFRPDKVPPALVTSEQKRQLLAELGVNLLVDVPFDMSIARLEPESFLQKLQQLGYSCLVVGSNFTYGMRGAGNIETLQASAAKFGFKLIVRELLRNDEHVISSTAIRELIAAGEMQSAAKMLGRSYCLTGTVAHGNERGRLLGFPTANLELADSKLAIPLGGVYAVRVHLNGQVYDGMANIGKNPTFGDVEKPRLETHIFEFNDDIYGERIGIEFVTRIRGEVKFDGLERLIAALKQDQEDCLAVLNR